MVEQARAEELVGVHKHKVYEKVPLAQCTQAGKKPIATRWVDVNKGDRVNPEYRSRLVAKEMATYKRDDLFAATPPLEAFKTLLSAAVTKDVGWNSKVKREGGMCLDIIDVKKAYFHSPALREIYVSLPPEDAEPGMCGKLLKSMPGTRDAAQSWEMAYSNFLVKIGFERGRACPCAFYHSEKGLRIVIHGDDINALGHRQELDWFRTLLAANFEVKFRARLGPGAEDDKAVRVLNRVLTWTPDGLTYEADQRHADLIVQALGLEKAQPVCTPGIRNSDKVIEPGDEMTLNAADSTKYRAAVARANYLAADRSDIAYAVKELSRAMAHPTQGDMTTLKRLGRYLLGKPRMVINFPYQDNPHSIVAWTDSDYAGCARTRKSTTGGLVTLGKHVVKHWSYTQAILASSSGEAECYSLVKGGSVSLGVKAILAELGMTKQGPVQLKTDATAAKGIAQRTGLGKVRHLEVAQLWLQDRVTHREMQIAKVPTTENWADALTKHVSRDGLEKHAEQVELQVREG